MATIYQSLWHATYVDNLSIQPDLTATGVRRAHMHACHTYTLRSCQEWNACFISLPCPASNQHHAYAINIVVQQLSVQY